ncbi:hypothetical protein [Lacrimispora sp.]
MTEQRASHPGNGYKALAKGLYLLTDLKQAGNTSTTIYRPDAVIQR